MVAKVNGQSSASMDSDGPCKKRARFADEEGKNMEEVMVEEAEESGAESEEDELPPYSVVGNDVTTIKMLSASNKEGLEDSFSPTYTHQVFRVKPSEDAEAVHEELIIGYENPRVEIVYAGNTLKAHVDFKHDGTVDVKLLRNERLARTNVLDAIHTHVPSDYAARRCEVEADAARTDFSPLGELVESVPGSKEGETLELLHFTADTPEATTFVNRLQTLVLWTIETGSGIKVPDPAWNIYTLYSRTEAAGHPVYSLVGFITAYRYWVYDRTSKSVEKSRLRVSQAVVLPPFQRKGHGARMLKAVYKAAQADPKVLDVSVEDPSPDFQALRDVTDLGVIRDGGDLAALTGDTPPLAELGGRYKLTPTQMKRLAEAAQFVMLGLTDPAADPEGGSGAQRALRLRIKQRMYKQALCETKGIGLLEDLGDEAPPPNKPKGDGKGRARPRHEEEEEEEVSPEEEQAARMVKAWAEGGDPDIRKEALRSMYKGLFQAHSATAARFARV
mmetsp:Transcript_11716/g.23123  ORF Transcript_11716/g.23123 Transcript_11716/m.23123 type:complete len:503 (+) Transcript_11716:35-1543(+)